MRIEFTEKSGVLIEPEGLFDYSVGSKCIASVNSYIRDYGALQITVDFRKTSFMDSSGIGSLIAMMRSLPNQSPAIRLIHPSPSVLKLMEVCHLHRLFEIVPQSPEI